MNIDGDEDRLIAILCLLQLCIGSRSRGIICINTFTMYDQADAHVLKSADDSVLSLLTMRPLITVKQLTKEKISSIQKASKLAIVGGDKFKNATKKIDLDDGLLEKVQNLAENYNKDVKEDNIDKLLALLLEIREDARKNKDWGTADDIRKKLEEIGFEIQDTNDGPVWRKK